MGSYFDNSSINASFLSSLLNNAYSLGSVGSTSNSSSTGTSAVNSSSIQNTLNTLIFQNMLQSMLSSMTSSDSNSSYGYGSLLSSIGANQNSDSYSNLLYSNNNYDLSRLLYNTVNSNSNSSVGINSSSSDELGALSSKYESNNNPGSIANNSGDAGGKSYGAWQFASKTGSVDSFVNWLKNNNYGDYQLLSSAKVQDGNSFGSNFDAAWKYIANQDKAGFLDLQKQYVKAAYYDTAVNRIKNQYGIDINSRSKALQDVLWSTAVQFGVGGTMKIFSHVNASGSDADIINDIYSQKQNVNAYFKNSSASIKQSVYNRALNEKADALAMLYSGESERG